MALAVAGAVIGPTAAVRGQCAVANLTGVRCVISGNRAFAGYGSRIYAWDITNAKSPRIIVTLQLPTTSGPIDRLEISGDVLVVGQGFADSASPDELRLVDVSNAATMTVQGVYSTPTRILDLAVSGALVALSGGSNDLDAGVEFVDIATPTAPVLLSRYLLGSFDEGRCVRFEGTNLFVSYQFRSGVRILSVADPLHPAPIGSYLDGTSVPRIEVADGRLFAPHGTDGRIDIVDVTSPANPTRLGGLFTFTGAYPVGVVENRLFVSSLHQSVGVDVSTPAEPFKSTEFGMDLLDRVGAANGYYFLSASMAVGSTMIANPPRGFETQPDNAAIKAGATATFTAKVAGAALGGYSWQRGGKTIANGPTGWGSVISGATTGTLKITNAGPLDTGSYVGVAGGCDRALTHPATLTVICPSDFTGDGFVTGDDFDAFAAAFVAGDLRADFNADGFVTGEDFDAYAAAFESGC